MHGGAPESVAFVKSASTIVKGVYEHGSYTRVLRYQYTAMEGILKQGGAQFHSLGSHIDRSRPPWSAARA